MKVEDLLIGLNLPIKYYDVDFDITDKYEDEMKEFVKGLKSVDGKEFGEEQRKQLKEKFDELITETRKNKKYIQDIFKYYEGANPGKAQSIFDKMMKGLTPNLFVSTIDDWIRITTPKGTICTKCRLTPASKFFRVRAVEGRNSSIENNPDELFHIPLTKKGCTSNERFSLAGFPSLYLASMLPLAWQECGYPEKYYFSEYRYDTLHNSNAKEFKLVSLYAPNEIYQWGSSVKYNNFELWLEVVFRCLLQYPLVMACSFVNHGGSVSYKQEYVIPQMLMQWVQRNSSFVQGISYFTCVDISMMPSVYCAYNIVIPVLPPYDEKKYSQLLRDNFTWTKPTFYKIPLLDLDVNSDDRKTIYTFIEKLRQIYKYGSAPKVAQKYLDGFDRISVSLFHLMKSGGGSDIQMIIHSLNLIREYARQLKCENIETVIDDIAGSKEWMLYAADQRKGFIKEFKKIWGQFFNAEIGSNGIVSIIDKHEHIIWNNCHCSSIVEIICKKDDKIDNIISWLKKNHLIFSVREPLDSDKKLFGKSGEEIQTPSICRFNDISIYNENNKEYCDFKLEGATVDKLDDLLL